VLSDSADVIYKCTSLYVPDEDAGMAWDDPDIGIDWPIDSPSLSDKDAKQGRMRDVAPGIV
jgi:dTDP-4-dehydrorhamnose 3,5-epimerase